MINSFLKLHLFKKKGEKYTQKSNQWIQVNLKTSDFTRAADSHAASMNSNG